MRKTFLKVSLLGALAFSMPLAITSCKDYDDDIESLNNETGSLKTQLSALETALSEAKTEISNAAQAAKNAQATADAAKAEADLAKQEAAAAKAEAELAKQAAATAKAEAISEAIAKVNDLLKSYPTKAELDAALTNYATKEAVQAELNKVASEIAAVDAKLVALDTKVTGQINDLTKFQAAAKTQIKALEEFKALAEKELAKLPGYAERISKLETKISSINKQLTDITGNITALQGQATQNSNDISEIKTKLANVSNDITALQGKVNTIMAALTNRLTSLDFIPTSYVDGIPAIDFSALKYKPLELKSGDKYEVKANAKDITTASAALASFYVHPVTTQLSDIEAKNITLVHKKATSRSSEDLTSVDNDNITLKDGILTIPVVKNATSNITTNTDASINIVSFKVPVKKDDAIDKEQPIVYSEFVRITEQEPFTVEIANAKDKSNHLLSYTDVKAGNPLSLGNSNNAEKTLFYCKWDGQLNLADKIDGCKVVNSQCNSLMNEETLAAYGLKLEYHVFKEKFVDNKDNVTNQQEFVKVSPEGLVQVNEKFSGVKENVIGRTPVITVVLRDIKNNEIVDVAYVAVKFTAHDMDDIILNKAKPIELGEDWLPVNVATAPNNIALGDAEYKLDWEAINKNIYATYGANGISHEKFAKIYTKCDWKVIKIINEKVDGTTEEAKHNAKVGTLNVNFMNPEHTASSEGLTWTMNEDDVKELLPYVKRTYLAEVRLSNEDGLYADAVFYLNATVKLTLPKAGIKSDKNWYNGVYRLEPIIYNSNMTSATTVTYQNMIFDAFVGQNMITPGMPYGKWDVQFTKEQPVKGYSSSSTVVPNINDAQTAGYSLVKDTAQAAQLLWNPDHEAWTNGTFEFADSKQKAHFQLYTSEAGKALVGNDDATATYLNPAGKEVKVASYVKFNQYNTYEVEQITMKIVRPINIATTTADKFYDGVINGSKISTKNLLNITDFHNYKVANVADDANATDEKDRYTQSLWNYYGISNVEFVYNDPYLVEDGKVTRKKMKDYYPSASISPVGNTTAGQGELVFNNPNSKVEKAFVIRIPVKVTYKFGVIESYVDVTINPAK